MASSKRSKTKHLTNSVRIAERRRMVKMLRIRGMDVSDIALSLGVSSNTVDKDIKAICQSLITDQDRTELRAFEVARIDDIYNRLYEFLPDDDDIERLGERIENSEEGTKASEIVKVHHAMAGMVINISNELTKWARLRMNVLNLDKVHVDTDEQNESERMHEAKDRVMSAVEQFLRVNENKARKGQEACN